ncbi:MAG: serine/threonine-protein kinase [Phycisphaerales bacterium]|nr:MAG: serine/threonine-protein kinase [Phycisphaerales bacterium]
MSDAEERNNKRPDHNGVGPTRSFDSSVTEPGGQIGPFRIERELGRGAVGVVYLAHDTKLDRSVAIKSLPAEAMANPKARSRFSREARVLASLNHPNIAAIYEELDEAKGMTFLVLEYVPGRTLAEQIARGPLKLDEALSICSQIAEALAAAHEHDVIHRDLKPGNIKITPEGKVKVLDFGLAKALGGETVDQHSTITEPGRIVGTPAYMSPEQVRGQTADKRTDIWSFGCVLYEMLTGRVPFEGKTISDTLAAVLDRDPDLDVLPKATPLSIRILLGRCLEKDVRRRLQDIGDARIEISDTLDLGADAWAGQITESNGKAVAPLRRVLALCLACLILGAVVTLVSLRNPLSRPGPAPQYGFAEPTLENISVFMSRGGSIALSPDGKYLVYVGVDTAGTRHLYVRTIKYDPGRTKVIRGTEGAVGPFFRPDGQWIGFFAEDPPTARHELKKVSIRGGTPEFICNVPPGPCGGSWSAEDDSIVFSPIFHDPLVKVSAAGGAGRRITELDPNNGEYGHLWPDILPGGKGVIYTVWGGESFADYRTMVKWKNKDEPQELLSNSSFARYVPTGHLVFMRQGSLRVVQFDMDNPPSGMIREDAHILRTGLGQTVYGGAQFTFAGEDGTFASADGTTPLGLTEGELVWVDPEDGKAVPIPDSKQFYHEWARPRLSPDEGWIALRVATETHLSRYKLGAGWFGPLTSLKGCQGGPVWEPDGNHIAFYHQSANSPPDVYWQPIDDGDAVELLRKTVNSEQGTSFSLDGRYLAMTVHFVGEASLAETSDILLFDMQTRTSVKWTDTPQYNEWGADFSPDGKWIAYVSNETGDNEVWIKEFRGNNREKISAAGGSEVTWGPGENRLELFYRGSGQFWRAEVEIEPQLKVVRREALFNDMYMKTKFPGHRCYDFSKERNRLLMIRKPDERREQKLMDLTLNWFEKLR